MIPHLDINPLFGAAAAARKTIDDGIMAAASSVGFLSVGGFPHGVDVGEQVRRAILQIFELSEPELTKLDRQTTDPAKPYSFRGRYTTGPRNPTHHTSFEFGRDLAYGEEVIDPRDPLRAPSPLPSESLLPGWRASSRAYYLAMERVAAALMASLARGLGILEQRFTDVFEGGISSLRLLHYPVRDDKALQRIPDEQLYVIHDGRRRLITSEPHFDGGFITILAQHGVEGLQIRTPVGDWVNVPPAEGTLVVNFGQLLDRWTEGRIRATEHRVLSSGRERFSIAFFFEPRIDAAIEPLPLHGAENFAPFIYGDQFWSATGLKRRGFAVRSLS